jgi:hypothetical protein
MTKRDRPRKGVESQEIKVQGITVRPGDDVLLLIKGRRVRRKYWRRFEEKIFLKREIMSTAIEYDEGPFHISMLRHPDILTGIAKEIDES